MNSTPYKVEPQSKYASLAEALDAAARGDTGYHFYGARGELEHELPYRTLREEAITLARKLNSLELPRGSRMAIVADTHPLFHRYFFACQYAGLIPVPVPAALQLGGSDAYVRQLRLLLESCSASIAVAPPAYVDFLHEAAAGLKIEIAGGSEFFEALPEADTELKPLGTGETAYLQ